MQQNAVKYLECAYVRKISRAQSRVEPRAEQQSIGGIPTWHLRQLDKDYRNRMYISGRNKGGSQRPPSLQPQHRMPQV